MWSLSPAHSCSLPPRDLTARLCLTLSVASCGPAGAPCPGPASHPPDYARAPVPLTTRHLRRVPGSVCTVRGFARTQVPTRHCDVHRRPHVPCAQGIGCGARAPPESQAALLLCAATCREPRRPQVPPLPLPPGSPRALGCEVPGPWWCSVLPSLPRMTFLPAPLPPSPATPPRPRTHPPPGPARPVICASLLPSQHLPRTVLASTRCACQGRCPWGGAPWGRQEVGIPALALPRLQAGLCLILGLGFLIALV